MPIRKTEVPQLGHALDRSLSVLERDVLRVLYLDVRFAFDAICLWHFYSAERALERGSI